METSKPWGSIFKVLSENNFKYSLSFRNKGKNKDFKKYARTQEIYQP